MSNKSYRRIQIDLKRFNDDAPYGIFLHADPANITHLHALIIGPQDTPYEGGFFYFDLNVANNYPYQPPAVLLKTTGCGRVRFNPNLYACGKVCLSLLGTWSGPRWSPALHFAPLLLSIQSLLCEQPWFNEPGREGRSQSEVESSSYNVKTRFHTLQFAVVDMLRRDSMSMPEELYSAARSHFVQHIDRYRQLCCESARHDGTSQADGYGGRVTVDFGSVQPKLETLYSELK